MGGETHNKMTSSSEYPTLAARPKGKQITHIYKDRLKQFIDRGQYYGQGLMSKIIEDSATGNDHVKLSVWSAPGQSRPSFKEATSHKFKETRVGESFGPSWTTHWFEVNITVPSHIRKHAHIEFHWDSNSEVLIWTKGGEVVHGLTGGGERTEWILPKQYLDGKEHTFYMEMACNGMFGNAAGGDSIQPPDENRYFQLAKADIVAVNLDARALYYDFWEISDAAREFPQDGWEAHEALQVCNDIMDCFIAGNGSKECIKDCRKIAQRYVGEDVDSSKVFETDQEAVVTAIGHCHIDTCWLWPWAETKRKVARSWANQCDLMERYPELRFAVSQAQQYKWLKEYYPSLYDRVKEKVKAGTFQPIGGSWVEHDTNMPSGESLVRQFLYGQRFFESHFGQRCQTFWLPDTFGYSTQLPQLCRLAGMSRFFTQKLSWNNINNFPHTTFNWVALDGSQVICHMAPSETYTAEAHFGDVKRSVTQHKSLDQDKTSLLVFGKGDGGGGPTFEHIEKLRRCRGISDKVGLLPRVKMGDSVEDFFDALEKKAKNGMELCTWYGELYFELHRGTYTTQANNKRNNRKGEILLHDIEWFATLASIKDAIEGGKGSSYRYPKKEIDEMWENVLLCQFHDCLPGSSIEMCYDDSDALYEKVFKTGERVLVDALNALGFDDDLKALSSDPTKLVTLHTQGYARSEMLKMPPEMASCKADCIITNDRTWDISREGQPCVAIQELGDDCFELSSASLIVGISKGVITSIYDVTNQRQVLAKDGKANQLVVFDDKPLYWQAWDVEVYHLESRKELYPSKSSIAENSRTRVAIVTETKVSEKSWVRTTISLSASSSLAPSLIEMDAEVEWQEKMKFLKVEFPVDINNTEASYETQFGVVRRPTHYNTSWDMAKFEVCCHKWADLSEANYGVSILNDSKYGFATQGNVMRLSLLRAPKAPDAHADMGRHHICYAIFPHSGALSHETVRAAINFNNPIRFASHPSPNTITPLLSAFGITGPNSANLVLDTIKRGEDDEDVSRGELPVRKGRSVIARVYDALGGRTRARLEWGSVPVKRAWKVNVLEDDGEELEIGSGGMEIEVRAFEVASYRLQL